MKNFLTMFGATVGVILLILIVICFSPMVFLWCINSLSGAGGSDFYINHTLWNYFVSLILMVVLRTMSRSSS